VGAHREQERIVAFLSDAAAYRHAAPDVRHVQTHITHAFLAGDFVYKLKKAVTFPFLDFGTIEKREHFCREEVRLNRRLAAPVYLDVVPVTETHGALALGGAGTPVDWVVRMRRMPAERDLGTLLQDPAFDGAAAMRAIAARVAAFHATAPIVETGGPEALLEAWDENLDGVRTMEDGLLPAQNFDLLRDYGRTYVLHHDAVLRARVARGHVRDGHGDLRADHVYVLDEPLPGLPDAPPVARGIWIVDCVEFSPAFRAVDVAADVSFLAMELEALGRPELARVLVGAYAEAADDPLVPALIPFHACHRAIVRGKVEGLAAADEELDADERRRAAERSRALFALAGRFAWRSGDPVVIACAGSSGTGKSAVAGLLHGATGFAVASSDVLRKASGTPHYAPDARHAVYDRMRSAVETSLVARESIIVDATFLERAERDGLARVAAGYGWRHVFVACEADEATVKRRLDARDATSVSDARWETYLAQRAHADPFGSDEPVLRIDTTGALADVRATLLPPLWAWRNGRPLAT
jgi:aminoglycoside phosphotransferase family enzyme/predicted kinase